MTAGFVVFGQQWQNRPAGVRQYRNAALSWSLALDAHLWTTLLTKRLPTDSTRVERGTECPGVALRHISRMAGSVLANAEASRLAGKIHRRVRALIGFALGSSVVGSRPTTSTS